MNTDIYREMSLLNIFIVRMMTHMQNKGRSDQAAIRFLFYNKKHEQPSTQNVNIYFR